MKKLISASLFGALLFFEPNFGMQTCAAAIKSTSETIDARGGQFRLLSADLYDEGDYAFRTSIQYFKDSDLLKDDRDVESVNAALAFGYAVFPYLRLSGSVGLDNSFLDLGQLEQSYNIVRYSLAATSAFDLGKYFNLPARRLSFGGSLWVDFTKVSRFFDAPNFRPTLILTTDFSENEKLPFRSHLNLGFQPGNGDRHFESNFFNNSTNQGSVFDFDRFATHTLNSYAVTTSIGAEFPYEVVNPSVEMHMEYVKDSGFDTSPKWVTLGLKARPFPQRNIELFLAGDLGLSSYKATAANEKPDAYAVPFWNIIFGFGLSQFGKKSSELAVDSAVYRELQSDLAKRNTTLRGLERDIAFNTITGRVIDAETKKPVKGVLIQFPEVQKLRSSTTDSNGRFTRYFSNLDGVRLELRKKGYLSSTKYLAFKPGESVQVNIELQPGLESEQGDLVLTTVDENGAALESEVLLINLESKEEIRLKTDRFGKISQKLLQGSYRLEIASPGFTRIQENIELGAGRAIIRTFSLSRP